MCDVSSKERELILSYLAGRCSDLTEASYRLTKVLKASPPYRHMEVNVSQTFRDYACNKLLIDLEKDDSETLLKLAKSMGYKREAAIENDE